MATFSASHNQPPGSIYGDGQNEFIPNPLAGWGTSWSPRGGHYKGPSPSYQGDGGGYIPNFQGIPYPAAPLPNANLGMEAGRTSGITPQHISPEQQPCADGTWTLSHERGRCSSHGGLANPARDSMAVRERVDRLTPERVSLEQEPCADGTWTGTHWQGGCSHHGGYAYPHYEPSRGGYRFHGQYSPRRFFGGHRGYEASYGNYGGLGEAGVSRYRSSGSYY
jgi:hypothetical protein